MAWVTLAIMFQIGNAVLGFEIMRENLSFNNHPQHHPTVTLGVTLAIVFQIGNAVLGFEIMRENLPFNNHPQHHPISAIHHWQ